MDSKSGRAVSTRWIRTCLSRSRRERRNQLLFGHSQDAFESDDEKFTDQIRVDILGPATHVILFKARDSFAYSGFDFPECLHMHFARAPNSDFTYRPAVCHVTRQIAGQGARGHSVTSYQLWY